MQPAGAQMFGGIKERIEKRRALPESFFCKECRFLNIAKRKQVTLWVRGYRPELAAHKGGEIGYLLWCECHRKKLEAETRKQAMVREANLPKRLDEIGPRNFSNFSPTPKHAEMMKAAADFAKGKGPPILTAVAGWGAGKTHLMEAAARQMLAHGIPVRYERVDDLLDRLRHTFNASADGDISEVFCVVRRV